VDAALWGLIGTVVGGVLTLLGNFLLHFTEKAARRKEEAAASRSRARDERKAAYLRLLTASRKLRYIARNSADSAMEEIDSLRTELSTVQYEIELIAAIAVVTRANDLRRATLDYLNAALSDSDPADIDKRRLATRAAVGHLIGAARTDLDIAPDDWGEASRRSLPR
jgi:hypothetical protein